MSDKTGFYGMGFVGEFPFLVPEIPNFRAVLQSDNLLSREVSVQRLCSKTQVSSSRSNKSINSSLQTVGLNIESLSLRTVSRYYFNPQPVACLAKMALRFKITSQNLGICGFSGQNKGVFFITIQ